MSNIEIKDLTFGYNDQLIFDKAQINIDDRWKLGLVGRNGRGKTTLLRILQGKTDAEISVKTEKKFVYFPQEVADFSNLTSFILGELADFEQWELERELTLLKVNLDALWRPFESLSGGEQTKCLLALLFLDKSNFALIDEPTNHLDMKSRATVANYLKKKSGFILVSHDRNFLNQTTDHILAIERQKLSLYQGNFATYEQEKKLRDDFELAENSKLRKEISRLKETAREKEDWSKSREKDKQGNPREKGSGGISNKGGIGARAARMMKKSKNLEKRMLNDISDKEKLLKNIEKIDSLSMNFTPSHHQNLLSFENFSLGFDENLFAPITFKLNKGEILAVTGDNGSGKSSLVKYLMNQFSGNVSGHFHQAHGIKISYVRQIYQNQGFLKDFARNHQLNEEFFLSNLRKLGMERKTFSQKIEEMSQGQQKKVELAKSLTEPADLYIWDEPLNYLDVFNHEQIAKLLKDFQPSLLVIEHDKNFIEELADKSIHLEKKI